MSGTVNILLFYLNIYAELSQSMLATNSFPFSGDSIRAGIASEPKLIIIWCLIIFFILTTIVILFTTIVLRKKKNQDLAKTNQLNEKYHQYLSELASGNYEDKALELMAADKETTLALAKEDFTEKFHRKTLLKELLSLHQEVAGEAAHKLREAYLTLGYKEESLNKLRSFSWMKRVQGIQELNQMDIKDGYQPLFKLINDNHHLVRLEAILARMKMDTNPLDLLDELEHELTEWEQLRIHNLLMQIPLEEIPPFLPYLQHPFKSVRLFAVKMTAVFNQAEAEPGLLELLSNQAKADQKIILESLSEIGSEKTVDYIHQHYEAAETEIKISMIQTLLSISGEEEAEFFAHQLSPKNYDIQLAAAKALVKLGEEKLENDSVISALRSNDEALNKVIAHAKEWHNQ